MTPRLPRPARSILQARALANITLRSRPLWFGPVRAPASPPAASLGGRRWRIQLIAGEQLPLAKLCLPDLCDRFAHLLASTWTTNYVRRRRRFA